MAGTTINAKVTGVVGSDLYHIRLELNKLIDNVEALRAGLAAGTGTQLTAVVADLAAIRTTLNALITAQATDSAAARVTINAIITAAGTNIAAVAAVTPVAAGTTVTPLAAGTAASVTATSFDAAADMTAAKIGTVDGTTT